MYICIFSIKTNALKSNTPNAKTNFATKTRENTKALAKEDFMKYGFANSVIFLKVDLSQLITS